MIAASGRFWALNQTRLLRYPVTIGRRELLTRENGLSRVGCPKPDGNRPENNRVDSPATVEPYSMKSQFQTGTCGPVARLNLDRGHK